MKVSVVFLACFVSLSYQYVWLPYSVPHSSRLFHQQHHHPSRYFYAAAPEDHHHDQPYQQPSFIFNPETLENNQVVLTGVDARSPSKFTHQKASERRFFFPLLSLSTLTSLLLPVTSTSTVFTTVTSSAITATVQSCLPTGQFLAAALAPVTVTCAPLRKRREFVELLFQDESISPSILEPVEPTAVIPAASHDEAPAASASGPEVSSSIASPADDGADDGVVGRQSRAFTAIVTTTVTITQFSFSTTLIKKSFSLAAANQLTCLPGGFNVC